MYTLPVGYTWPNYLAFPLPYGYLAVSYTPVIGDLSGYAGGVSAISRDSQQVSFHLNDRPGVTGYRVWCSKRPEHLYGQRTGANLTGADDNARQLLFRVAAGVQYLSPSMVRQGFRFPASVRRKTQVCFDLSDYRTPAVPQPLPREGQTMYLAIQPEMESQPEALVDGLRGRPLLVRGVVDTGRSSLGPITIIPPAEVFIHQKGILMVQGSAPSSKNTMYRGRAPTPDFDQQKPNPLHLVFPKPVTTLTIRSSGDMLYSFGMAAPVSLNPAGATRTFRGSISEVCLSADSNLADTQFTLEAVLTTTSSSLRNRRFGLSL